MVSGTAFSYPTTMNVIEGTLFTGGVESLTESLDDAAQIFNDEASLRAVVELAGPAPAATFSKLWFLTESSVERRGVSLGVELFDFTANNYVNVGGQVADTEDRLFLAGVATNALRFKGPGGQVMARLTWGPINDEDPSQDGWLHNIDVARWEITP
jgi:hypothetical protein